MSKEQIDKLFSAAIDEAVMLLEKQGEFFPFAFGMKHDESIALYSAFDGEEHPPSGEVIDQLINGLHSEAKNKNIIASAITYEVNVTFDEAIGPQSAICVALEHETSSAVTCYKAYELNGSKVQGGDVLAQEGDANVFT